MAEEGGLSLDPDVGSVLGTSIGEMSDGEAAFALRVTPLFHAGDLHANHSIPTLERAEDLGRLPQASGGQAWFTTLSYIWGMDEDTGVGMKSDTIQTLLPKTVQPCPRGYILQLDGQAGRCVQCALGKYSLHPLVGYADGKPECLRCPSGASACPGGSRVDFNPGSTLLPPFLLRPSAGLRPGDARSSL